MDVESIAGNTEKPCVCFDRRYKYWPECFVLRFPVNFHAELFRRPLIRKLCTVGKLTPCRAVQVDLGPTKRLGRVEISRQCKPDAYDAR